MSELPDGEEYAGPIDVDDGEVVAVWQSGNKRKQQAAPAVTAVAERAAVTPLARHVDRVHPCLALTLPEHHQLVSASTYRVIQWGLSGHRDIVRFCGAALHTLAKEAGDAGHSSVPLDPETVAVNREEWSELPFVVPQTPPREGYMYVTHEANDKINVGSELYHRIYIEEGTLPKQARLDEHEARVAASKEAEKANRSARKLFGETAPLGVRLTTVKTTRNGDCFFDAICKAFRQSTMLPMRDEEMWRTAFGSGADAGGGAPAGSSGVAAEGGAAGPSSAAASMPPPSEAPTVKELRGVLGAHFPEDAWLIGQSVGGDSFAFIVAESLDLTRANVAALAQEAGERAYWADESAIAVGQRYLNLRLLIFNPSAAAGNRCHCAGEAASRTGAPCAYVILSHTHRASKAQHYELYALPAPRGSGLNAEAVFDEGSLPAGVKRAFADVCVEAPAAWKTAV